MTTTATGTPTLQRSESRVHTRSRTRSRYLFQDEIDRSTYANESAATTTNESHSAPSKTAHHKTEDWLTTSCFDAEGYPDPWNDGWDSKNYKQRRIALSGLSSATRHSLWIRKQGFHQRETKENVKEMVVKRQGPWARPPPPPQNVTSNCMTCNTMMRYPGDAEEFRCPICATANTVATLAEKSAERQGEREKLLKAKKKNGEMMAGDIDESLVPQSERALLRGPCGTSCANIAQVKPLSVAFTKYIIEDSIRTYLIARFCTEHITGTSQATAFDEQGEGSEPPPYTKEDPSFAAFDKPHYESKYHFSSEPTLRKDMHNLNISASRFSMPQSGINDAGPSRPTPNPKDKRRRYFEEDPLRIFRPVRDYIAHCFNCVENINHSFLTEKAIRPTTAAGKRGSTSTSRSTRPSPDDTPAPEPEICAVDPKLLLLGDVAKNGSWWLGGRNKGQASSTASRKDACQTGSRPPDKTPSLNFAEIERWYNLVRFAADDWDTIWAEVRSRPDCVNPTAVELKKARQDIFRASVHVNDRLMKYTEDLLRKVGGQLTQPEELRFLLFILENPLLDGESDGNSDEIKSTKPRPSDGQNLVEPVPPSRHPGPIAGRHSVILKRVIGLIANCPAELHHHLVSWLSNYDRARFVRIKDIVSGFLTYRLIRQEKSAQVPGDVMNNLIPALRPGGNVGSLHEAIKQGTASRRKFNPYCSDWQVKAAAQVLAIFFEANNPHSSRHALAPAPTGWKPSLAQGVFLPMSDFYNSMVDYVDLVADFEEFGKKGGKFSFCYYPFLMSVWAKTQVLDFDSKRQMKETARDAFFDNLLRHTHTSQTLTFDVRRDCLADDSLRAIAETMGSVSNESKKALRIKFRGEEGIDGGGLRKEWFLLLVREVFNPDLGKLQSLSVSKLRSNMLQDSLSTMKIPSTATSTLTRLMAETNSIWLASSLVWPSTTQLFWTFLCRLSSSASWYLCHQTTLIWAVSPKSGRR